MKYAGAQVQEVISGVVRNESNEPLDGAIISVPDNPEYTTSSDKDGKYPSVEIPSGASMVICKIPGYRNQTMKFTLNKPVEFCLISDIAGQDTSLEVAMLQKERKGGYTGAISTGSGRRVS